MKFKAERVDYIGRILARIFTVSAILAFIFHIPFLTDADFFLNSDYMSFLTGAKILSQGKGSAIYDIQTQTTVQQELKLKYKDQIRIYPREALYFVLPYRNLPFVALIFTPLTLLPGLTSYRVFAFINLFLFLFIIFDISRNLAKNLSFEKLLFFSLLFLPFLTSIYRGQITVISLLIFYLIYRNLLRGRYFKAGIFCAFLLVKLQYLLVLPFLIFLSKDLKEFLKGFVITAVPLLIISFLISGEGLFNYLQFILLTEQSKFGSRPNEILTLFSFLRRFIGSNLLPLIINITAYFLSFYLFIRKKFTLRSENVFGLIILNTLIFGIHMTDNDLILLLIPLFLVLNNFRGKLWQILYMLISIIIPYLRFTYFSSYEILFLILLGVLLVSQRDNEIERPKQEKQK